MAEWENVPFTVAGIARKEPVMPAIGYVAKALDLTWSWGSRPAAAEIEYIESGVQAPIVVGSEIAITVPGNTNVFYGVCVADVVKDDADGGRVRQCTFHDNREFLGWDQVFGIFNKPVTRLEGEEVKRYYWSVLPADFGAYQRIFHGEPYSAREIVMFFLGAPTVFTNWSVAAGSLNLLDSPIYGVEFKGVSLDAALLQISERLGAVFTLKGGPYTLEWCRKGMLANGQPGVLPASTRDPLFAGTNDRRLGYAFSGNPSGVRIVGDRNLYQVANIPMVPDWSPGWEAFYHFDRLKQEIYAIGKTPANLPGIPANTRLNAIPGDMEGWTGEQLALGLAYTMTVAEFIQMEEDDEPGSGAEFLDRRLCNGQSRMNMPAMLYIQSLLFRAFRCPLDFTFQNAAGEDVTMPSAEIVPRLLTKIEPNIVTGDMTAVVAGVVEGNGYAMAQGYNIGADLYRIMKPSEFDIETWTSWGNLWQPLAGFQVDESAEDGGFIVFDEPIVRGNDLFELVDGHAVAKENAVFTMPAVKATLVFAAEPFVYTKGDSYRNAVEQVASLNGEFYLSYGGAPVELAYADGEKALEKAEALADEKLSGALIYGSGGWTYAPGIGETPAGRVLEPMTDRVGYRHSAEGKLETVDFGKEAGPRTFVETERNYDRREALRKLFPGQMAGIVAEEKQRQLAVALRRDPKLRKFLKEAYENQFGLDGAVAPVGIKDGAGTLKAGTPLWSEPLEKGAGGKMEKTRAVLPAAVADAHQIFRGCVVLQNADARRSVGVKNTGTFLARVLGPVEVDDMLGRENGADYLVVVEKNGVCVAQQKFSPDYPLEVRLIEVRIGGGGGATGDMRWQ